MYLFDDDRMTGSYVARFAPGGDQQSDFDDHLVHLGKALVNAKDAGRTLALIILFDSGHEIPSATRRARIAEFQSQPVFTPHVVVVSGNPLLRGVITALDWLRGKKAQVLSASTVSEAVRMLEVTRGAPIEGLLTRARLLQDRKP